MKQFLSKILVFSVIGLLLLLFLGTVLNKRFSDPDAYRIGNNISTVILGNSHPECAFNDSLMTDCKNLAQSAESYFYTYPKLKQILNSNPNIQLVLLEFSTLDIIKPPYRWTFGEEYFSYFYSKYSYLLRPEDKLLLFKNNPVQFLKAQSLGFKSKLFYNGNNVISSFKWGGYNEQRTDTLIADTSQYVKDATMTYSDMNLGYLDKIVQLCKEKGVTIMFLRSPVHPQFKKYFEDEYQQLLANKYSNIRVIDFKGLTFSNEDFKDLGHLNYRGSVKASKYIDSVIRDTYSSVSMLSKQTFNAW